MTRPEPPGTVVVVGTGDTRRARVPPLGLLVVRTLTSESMDFSGAILLVLAASQGNKQAFPLLRGGEKGKLRPLDTQPALL